MGLRFWGLLVAGCGAVHFTEPNPPQLFRNTASYTAGAAGEPVVWMPVLDLFTEKGGDCAAAREWTLHAIRDAMSAAATAHSELAYADLSPSCAQSPDRTLDVPSLKERIRAGLAAYPANHPRVLLVFANDIALPLPGKVIDGMQALRQGGLLWTVGRDPVGKQLSADRALDWSFLYDPALRQLLATTAAQDLPLQTDVIDPRPKPLLAGADLPRAREVKLCAGSSAATVQNIATDGSASPVHADQPPLFEVHFQQRYAVVRSNFVPLRADLSVEGCSANCDRYFSSAPGDLRRWDTTTGCLLETP